MALSPPHFWSLTTLLLLLVSAAHADYYRPATYVPVPVPKHRYTPKYVPVPVPKPRYTPTYAPKLSVNSLAYQFQAPQNVVREALGLPPLTWDAGLAGYAATYAEQRRDDCALVHSDGPYGENIFWGSGSDWSAGDAVKSWTDEAQYYDFATNSCGYGECGHYTQIVWRTSTRLGCARIVCNNDAGVFVICSYDPPGNIIGSRPY